MKATPRFYLIILALAALVSCRFLFCSQHKQPVPTGRIEPTKMYRDDSGIAHGLVKVVQTTAADKGSLNETYQALIDSMSRALKIKDTKISDLVRVIATSSGIFRPQFYQAAPPADTAATSAGTDSAVVTMVQVHPDSLHLPPTEVRYNDEWLSLSGRLDTDSAWRYRVTEELVYAKIQKKDGLYLDVSSRNPNTVITGVTSLMIVPRARKWAVSLQAGYFYNGTVIRPGIGLGISKTIFKF